MFTFKNYLNLPALLLVGASAMSLTSCDNTIYEDLKPCEVKHAVRFQFTNNMSGGDAFANNVRSVAIYVFDKDDKYVTKFTEAGDILAMQGYTLPIEGLEPGEYTFVAWCGLENEGTRAESFEVDKAVPGVTSRRDMMCTMRREIRPDKTHHSSEELYDLYHGTAYGVTIYPAESDSMLGDHVYTINLTKDTNNVSVILQNISGEELDINDFSFKIEENNGTLKTDNTLDEEDEVINYHEYETFQGKVEFDGTRSETLTTGMALLKISRLMADKHSYLTVTNEKSGERVGRIPMIDYALIGKVGSGTGKTMMDQEYLDCQDNYQLTFFLDKNGNWLNTSIVINDWTIYINDETFNN